MSGRRLSRGDRHRPSGIAVSSSTIGSQLLVPSLQCVHQSGRFLRAGPGLLPAMICAASADESLQLIELQPRLRLGAHSDIDTSLWRAFRLTCNLLAATLHHY